MPLKLPRIVINILLEHVEDPIYVYKQTKNTFETQVGADEPQLGADELQVDRDDFSSGG